ncbi:hypothetical protein E1162_03770 [Rhodobacteraceae bacterium RKSG542]|uniref:hypothetical protein n=1 Tax=Pseudovibrio flavus TaxID=2529854 RepID=UPI0012BB5F55|nr:hypothetical protein [Pseudovibrio flavus]MTI16356.1 hypothetical protein [Pseudovibrio flavus]
MNKTGLLLASTAMLLLGGCVVPERHETTLEIDGKQVHYMFDGVFAEFLTLQMFEGQPVDDADKDVIDTREMVLSDLKAVDGLVDVKQLDGGRYAATIDLIEELPQKDKVLAFPSFTKDLRIKPENTDGTYKVFTPSINKKDLEAVFEAGFKPDGKLTISTDHEVTETNADAVQKDSVTNYIWTFKTKKDFTDGVSLIFKVR